MSLVISGTYQSDAGLALSHHNIGLVYLAYKAEGLTPTYGNTPVARNEIKVQNILTDLSGNYSFSLSEDITAFGLFTGRVDLDYLSPEGNTWPFQYAGGIGANSHFGAIIFYEGCRQAIARQPVNVAASYFFPGIGPTRSGAYVGGLLLRAEGVGAEAAAAFDGSVFLTGSRTIDLTATGHRQKIQARGLCRNDKYYQIDGVELALTFLGGGSESVTTDANGLADVTGHDLNDICSITVASGGPDCSTLNTYSAWVNPLLANPTWVAPFIGGFFNDCSRTPFDTFIAQCTTEVLIIDLLSCVCGGSSTPPATDFVRADTHTGQIAVAWTNGGKLYTSVHRSAQKAIGDGATGWETKETVESANASDCGIAFLPNGVCYLTYDLSAAKKYRTNKAFAASGFWSATGTPSPAVSRHSAVGRGQEQTFRFRALGSLSSAGNIEFSQCRDNRGVSWTSPVTVVTGARGAWCGGVWLGNKYGCLYTKHADGKIYWLEATDPATWSGGGTDTGMTGQVAGLTLTSAGVLVGLVWAWDGTTGNKHCRACRSRDRGKTWEKDSADIAVIPALDTPPAVVDVEHLPVAVYVVSDAPQFACSLDSGVTWK